MSILIIATAGSPQANSYVDQPTALDYLTNQRMGVGTEWTGLDTDTQSKYLIWATAFLDQIVRWKGYKATRDQALRWPRSGVYDPDGFYVDKSIIPIPIQQITSQTAWEYAKVNRQLEPGLIGQGFDQVGVGGISVHVNADQQLPFFPPYLATLIGVWGQLRNNGGPKALTQSKLLRT